MALVYEDGEFRRRHSCRYCGTIGTISSWEKGYYCKYPKCPGKNGIVRGK